MNFDPKPLSHDEFARMMTPSPLTKEELELKARVRAIKLPEMDEKDIEVEDLDEGFEVKVNRV